MGVYIEGIKRPEPIKDCTRRNDMNSAILVTKYHENCAECPCCLWGEYSFSCQAHDDDEICEKEEYYSHRKYNMTLNAFEGEYKAPRPDWCPLIELKEGV